MRLSLWLFVCLFYLQLPTYSLGKAQADRKITLSGTFTYHQIFRSVEKQTGKRVYYTNSIINDEEQTTVHLEQAPLQVALAQILKNKDLEWVIDEKYISLKRHNKSSHFTSLSTSDSSMSITGKVITEDGIPISGATVLIKGSSLGTTSSADGSIKLRNVKSDIIIIISSIGFISKEVFLKVGNSLGTVQLERYVGTLDETQIIAYGQTSRRISTGNISTVKAKDIEKSPVANPLLAIAARVPGVFIQQSTGTPGSGIKIIIQGQNSINGGNDPFYVIDGVPFTSQLLPGLTGELGLSGPGTPGANPALNTQGNPLNFINIQDIESIDILKDADATAIYGSRAANGAIIITTKKGKSGKTAFNVNYQNGWGEISKKVKLLNTEQYLEMRKEAYANNGVNTYPVDAYDLNGTWDLNKYTDWQNELLGGTAKYTNIHATLSGGSSNIQYLLGGGYQSEGTVTPGDLSDRKTSVHFNINSTSTNQKFKVNFSGSYVSDNNKLAVVSDIASRAFTMAPNSPQLYNDDGSLNWEIRNGVITFFNPLVNLGSKYINKTSNLLSNATFSYELIPGLDLKSSFGYNKLLSDEVYASTTSLYPAQFIPYLPRTANFNTAEISNWIIEPQITFIKKFGPGVFNALVGATIQQEDRNRQNLKASGFSSDESMLNLKAASSVIVADEDNAVILSQYKYNAIFGRINYNLKNTYLLTFTTRRDGSSRFGQENRFHNFFSVAGAWTFSNEHFIKDNLPFISFGKIRSSYGITGNDQIGDYSYLNLYQNVSTLGTNYQGIVALSPFNNFPNPYLQWELTKKLSATLDLGVLKDRILFAITYYKNRSSNQLSTQSLLAVTGGNGINTNLPAVVENKGFELSLNSSNMKGNHFTWNSSINVTIPQNRLVGYSGIDAEVKDEFVGKALGSFKVYNFSGVNPSSGVYEVIDRNGKATSNPDASLDKTIFIDLNPKYYGGFQNSFSYRGLSLDVLFQFVKQLGGNGYFGSFLPGVSPINEVTSVLERWQKPGDNTSIQKFTTDLAYADKFRIAAESNRAYSDASYIRLKNLSLSYQFSSSLIKKSFLQSARIYVQGQNLLTFTKYVGGDPENRTLRGMPPLKMLTLGAQIVL
ncbi:SusC/RagA family TonB-linked outer membrane protein [Chitinophaga pinensis]|uniref:TonB-dependent receptor plug n=1 Tax=Chitinophaga pinensis (strain ATCC 43595 / DSM 2588 / LMG 13176 / NBRC 15968 / NCIMB 11800 / UQM 2034) TaxID=485918 RepID=A0A979GUY1_CHIPD|nr:SusC/RagA family TonB-linked outer membrane protein [Chitinophaga pinensis]ACU60681.1 TonB-dependent receptor plug [Chitinophaga pinensis DSM 2588]